MSRHGTCYSCSCCLKQISPSCNFTKTKSVCWFVTVTNQLSFKSSTMKCTILPECEAAQIYFNEAQSTECGCCIVSVPRHSEQVNCRQNNFALCTFYSLAKTCQESHSKPKIMCCEFFLTGLMNLRRHDETPVCVRFVPNEAKAQPGSTLQTALFDATLVRTHARTKLA